MSLISTLVMKPEVWSAMSLFGQGRLIFVSWLQLNLSWLESAIQSKTSTSAVVSPPPKKMTLISFTLEPGIWSHGAGQEIPFDSCQLTITWMQNKSSFFVLYTLVSYSQEMVPYYWCHFYGELDREMLNVEGSRTDTTCRTCTSCQLKLGLFSRKASV